MEDYRHINRQAWNRRTEVHQQSNFYNQEAFLKGKNSLNSIELDLLGSVVGKKILHLQCHFGQDSLSLVRQGAAVTGVDLSDKAIDLARQTAQELNLPADFICCDLYDLPQHLDDQFDLVFTTYGTIGWLPDLNAWAQLIQRYLKPNGRLIFVEFHPVLWIFDADFSKIEYRYFQSEAIVETAKGTYTDGDEQLQVDSVSWNHGLAEVFRSLKQAGLRIDDFQEYDYSPYPCFKGMVDDGEGHYRLAKHQNKLPMVYSLVASKNKS